MTAQINSQLAPRSVRGLGASGTSLPLSGSIASNPDAVSQWGIVNAQLNAEGADASTISDAQSQFVSAHDQLLSVANNLSSQDVATAAASFVVNGKTALGAVANVVGLVNGLASGVPSQTVQAVVGLAIAGAGVVVGATGVGAAVAVGIELLGSVITSLFGQPNPSASICNATVSPPPNYQCGCTYNISGSAVPAGPGTVQTSGGQVVSSQSNPHWRAFPIPSRSSDAPWFVANSWMAVGASIFSWLGDQWGQVWRSQSTLRPIDNAFWMYHHLESEASLASFMAPFVGAVSPEQIQALVGFTSAYFAAWKSNQEYLLNGLAPQSDAQVLVEVARLWNRAHLPGVGLKLSPPSASSGPGNAIAMDAPPGAVITAGTYEQLLLNTVSTSINLQQDDPAQFNVATTTLTINTGARKDNVPGSGVGSGAPGRRVLPPRATGPATASSSTSTIMVGTAAVVAAGALAAFLYARHKHVPVKTVLRSTWNKTGGRIHVPHHLPKIKLPKSLRRSR